MEFFNFSGPHAEFSNIISYISVIYIQIFIQDELNGFITSPSRSISDPLKKIHDVIKAVREGPTPLPSTILYRFVIRIFFVCLHIVVSCLFTISRVTNPYSNLQCATLSTDATMLITGCENASLISWDLLPRQPTTTLHNGYTNSEVTISKNYF